MNNVTNPISGSFGTGQVQFFSSSGVWVLPVGISQCRVRVWGAGGGSNTSAPYVSGGAGGGFAMKTIYGLSVVPSIAVTVGLGGSAGAFVNILQTAGTSSFGAYVSATGGSTGTSTVVNNIGGVGVGGDFNFNGGLPGYGAGVNWGAGGGSASLFGPGGRGSLTDTINAPQAFGGAGGGQSNFVVSQFWGGAGGFGNAGALHYSAAGVENIFLPQSGMQSNSLLDYIGTGGGGAFRVNGVNGGGGGNSSFPGYPGGGASYNGLFYDYPSPNNLVTGANGLVIVEY